MAVLVLRYSVKAYLRLWKDGEVISIIYSIIYDDIDRFNRYGVDRRNDHLLCLHSMRMYC